jgi:hypothetical protein
MTTSFVPLQPSWMHLQWKNQPPILSTYLPVLAHSQLFVAPSMTVTSSLLPPPPSTPLTEGTRKKQELAMRIARIAADGILCIADAQERLSINERAMFHAHMIRLMDTCNRDTIDYCKWCDAQDTAAGMSKTRVLLPLENVHCATETALRNLKKRTLQLCDEVTRYAT